MASGVAWRLYQCGYCVLITEVDQPLAVRRRVAFCEAVYDGKAVIEGVESRLIQRIEEADPLWRQGKIPVMVDPGCEAKHLMDPDVLIDATMAKRNLGTSLQDAPLLIGLGPGFEAGRNVHFVVETKRGHSLGRLITRGRAEADTGVPGPVMGVTTDRLLRSPGDGPWQNHLDIGARVQAGDIVGSAGGREVKAKIDGVLRGLIRPGIPVKKGLKIGDIDPRGEESYCYTISEKALAIAGGALEGILRFYRPS